MTIYGIGTGMRLLDWVYERISDPNQLWAAMDALFDGLYEVRGGCSPDEWKHFIATVAANHPLRTILNEDPISARSCAKPRGYSGDAVLLDLIYKHENAYPLIEESSEIGRSIYSFMVEASAARGVRLRRKLIAETIDAVADTKPAPDILSIACGHIREAELSHVLQKAEFSRFVGLDHDALTIDYDAKNFGQMGVELVHGNALHLIKGAFNLGEFDLIYASGLFDYLSQGLAQKLAAQIFSMLRPGGKMLIINAVPNMRDTGYMEAFMDWHLIYRDLDELVDIAATIPREAIADQDVFLEDNQNFAFLQISKQ